MLNSKMHMYTFHRAYIERQRARDGGRKRQRERGGERGGGSPTFLITHSDEEGAWEKEEEE